MKSDHPSNLLVTADGEPLVRDYLNRMWLFKSGKWINATVELHNPKLRPVKGYEDNYLCDEEGTIYSLLQRSYGIPQKLKSRNSGDGKYIVQVKDSDGIMKTKQVGRLINLTFNGDPPAKGYVTLHINGKNGDNRAKNLRWVSRSELILLAKNSELKKKRASLM